MAFVKLADNYTDLIGKFAVALLAEGVDRNSVSLASFCRRPRVALLAEGVDRNLLQDLRNTAGLRRPPRGGRG